MVKMGIGVQMRMEVHYSPYKRDACPVVFPVIMPVALESGTVLCAVPCKTTSERILCRPSCNYH